MRSGIDVSIKVVNSPEPVLTRIIKEDVLDWKKKCWPDITHPKLLTAREKC